MQTVEALTDLGPIISAQRDFNLSSKAMLDALLQAGGAKEAVLFRFVDKPSMLTSIGSAGFVLMPEPAVIPLLPRHIHALLKVRSPLILQESSVDLYLSANGNVAPQLFKCLAPLQIGGQLVGVAALGRRETGSDYVGDDLEALELLCNYLSLALQNHNLSQTLAQRVADNLRMLSSLHGFYDNALDAFASAIDVKHINIHGHSQRVGRYAAGIGEALGLDASEIEALRSAGLLHDIGKVAVDKRLFAKEGTLDAEEFREMADHTVVGHQIVSGVQFPWPNIPEIVRWHHERADGSGYPDGLRLEETPLAARIVGLADTLDAMTSERPYRESISVGRALSEIVRMTPTKFDPKVVQALLLQMRREAVGSHAGCHFFELSPMQALSPADVDQLAASLQHRTSQSRVYLV